MIVCPNCNHQNPDGAQICEACYTPLPAMTSCPNCGATVQSDATFCGQCGYSLKSSNPAAQEQLATPSTDLPDLVAPEPPVEPDLLIVAESLEQSSGQPNLAAVEAIESQPAAIPASSSKTQLQQQTAQLIHERTDRTIELPQNLSVIHLGKPNDRIPPDVDVSGFPDADVVSRIHADIRVEGDSYYIEDVGSSNGTYINNVPLLMGNRHRLRPGDRISLGKNNLVSFIFQIS